MKKTIYLHIGTHKTGSTALQNFCALNLDLLKQYDIDYLIQDTIWNGHHFLGWAFRGNDVSIEQYCKFKDIGVLNHLEYSIEQSGCNIFLLSSENLFLMEDESYAKRFFERFKGYEIKVIVYLREQSEFLESWYYELVRADYCSLTQEFEEYLKNPQYELDYSKVLTKWARYVGKDSIKVISYNEIKKNRSLYTSFINSLGISNIDGFKIPESTNERVNYKQLLRIKEINKEGLDPKIRNELVRGVINNEKLKSSKNISFISKNMESYLINRYYDSNEKMLNMFGVKVSDKDLKPNRSMKISFDKYVGLLKDKLSLIKKFNSKGSS